MAEKRPHPGSPSGPSTDSLENPAHSTPSAASGLFSFKIPNYKPSVQLKQTMTRGRGKENKNAAVKVKLEEPDGAERPLLELGIKPEVIDHLGIDLGIPEFVNIKQEIPDQLGIKKEELEHPDVKQEDLERIGMKLEIPLEQESRQGIPTLIHDLINVFLSKKDYNLDTRVEEKPCVVIRALKYVVETLSEIPESSTEESLTLATAKDTAEEICNRLHIPTDQRAIYCCIFCDRYNGFGFEELFDHVEARHHRQIQKNWRSAPWPKILPVRCMVNFPPKGEGFKIVIDNMREILWKTNEFRMMHAHSRLALWFRLSIDWYINFCGFREPGCEPFFRCALFIQEDTEHSIFRTIQCNLCGNNSSHHGTKKWNLYDLKQHFKYAHDPHEEFGSWMHKMIGLPPDRNLSSFGEEITDENTRKQWLGLWKQSDEGLEILDGLRVAIGMEVASGRSISATPLATYSEDDIL